MVFKARGCRTCVQRRIKCDTTKPKCGKCIKANRSCIWDPNEQAGLRFQDESAFAQGKARRPRNPKNKPANTAVAIVKPPTTAPRPALSISLDEHAFQYWTRTNVSHAESLHEAAHEWHTYVLPYWMKAKPGSCLHLAVSTLSRAVFGRSRDVPQALVQAGRSYAQCLARTQHAVSGQLHESMDELLLTTMLMGYYENIRYSVAGVEPPVKKVDAVGSSFTNVFCHYEGAMGLVEIRQKSSQVRDVTLDKVARRQLIRASILQGNAIPGWLQDGALFGETGPALQIDSLMVRVAAFRSRALSFFANTSATLPTSTPDLEYLAHTGKELEDDLVQWADLMSGEWKACRQDPQMDSDANENSEKTYDNIFNYYTSYGHASLWIRQRALRLIINSVLIKFIAVRMQNSTDHEHLRWKQNRMRANLASTSSELCGDVAFFFSRPRSEKSNSEDVPREYAILPRLASLLAWPLAVAVSTENVPEPQRQWLQNKLVLVARSLGDAILGRVAERGAFIF